MLGCLSGGLRRGPIQSDTQHVRLFRIHNMVVDQWFYSCQLGIGRVHTSLDERPLAVRFNPGSRIRQAYELEKERGQPRKSRRGIRRHRNILYAS